MKACLTCDFFNFKEDSDFKGYCSFKFPQFMNVNDYNDVDPEDFCDFWSCEDDNH